MERCHFSIYKLHVPVGNAAKQAMLLSSALAGGNSHSSLIIEASDIELDTMSNREQSSSPTDDIQSHSTDLVSPVRRRQVATSASDSYGA